jgi:hypothetical protein
MSRQDTFDTHYNDTLMLDRLRSGARSHYSRRRGRRILPAATGRVFIGIFVGHAAYYLVRNKPRPDDRLQRHDADAGVESGTR